MLLTKRELDSVSKWTYAVDDRSITTEYLTPLWNACLEQLPVDVAPNCLTLAGFLCVLFATAYTYLYATTNPITTPLVCAALVFVYQTLDALDGKQARRIGNSSPLGELFDHACDNVGVVFLTMTGAHLVGVVQPLAVWCLVHAVALLFAVPHVEAMGRRTVTFGRYTGPGECLVAFQVLCVLCSVASFVSGSATDSTTTSLVSVQSVQSAATWLPPLAMLVTSLGFGMYMAKLNNLDTFEATCLVLWLPCTELMLFAYRLLGPELTWLDIVGHGLLLSVITSDLIVAKMANHGARIGRPVCIYMALTIGPMLLRVWFDAATVIMVANVFTYTWIAYYYQTIFLGLAAHQRIPMFKVWKRTTVYVDGVFDLMHAGHNNHLLRAADMGQRLIVGVMSDDDCAVYKRMPVMTLDERVAAVRSLGVAHEVIAGAPCFGLTKQFLDKHDIDVVACSEEYRFPKDDELDCYAIPRVLGRCRFVPRTGGISSSKLIRRIEKRFQLHNATAALESACYSA
jgi:cytidyltransferase-like protein